MHGTQGSAFCIYMNIEQLFFELIRVAIGTQDTLTRAPSAQEWKALYDMAKKQSLVGVCFAGVQRLGSVGTETSETLETSWNLPEVLYLTWMGVAAKIQQRNEVVNRQCVELQQMLTADGFCSCILKGQGNAKLYPEHLHNLRQSGDIDVWLDAPKEKIGEWARAHGGMDLTGDLHVDCEVFADTAVEIHFTPSICSGKKMNKRLQDWFESRKNECMTNKVGAITTPTSDFNQVYLMHHIFRHYLYEGIGLRHIMDYYMVLQTERMLVQQPTKELVRAFGMEKFAGALMWVMKTIFAGHDNDDDNDNWLLCEPDEKRGRRLLEVIMEGGNFGHGTEKYKVTGWDKPWSRLSRYVRRNWYMLWDYPDEIIWNMIKKLKI